MIAGFEIDSSKKVQRFKDCICFATTSQSYLYYYPDSEYYFYTHGPHSFVHHPATEEDKSEFLAAILRAPMTDTHAHRWDDPGYPIQSYS